MLGEPNTEQFEITTEVGGDIVYRQKIHDPFIRTTTTVKGLGAAWKCVFGGLQITTRVNGSHGAMNAIMKLDPDELSAFERASSFENYARNIYVNLARKNQR